MSQLAFPSAMGAGAYSTGGRGGQVVHVTNLNDSGTGSLRWAITDSSNNIGAKTIVFDVSGIIQLNSDIIVSSPDVGGSGSHGVYLAGQSSPQGNITITGGKIRFLGIDDLVVRYIKGRSTTNTDGVINSNDGNNTIFDHITASHVESGEVAIGITSNAELVTNRTVQNCLVFDSGLGIIAGDTTPPSDSHNEAQSIINNAFVNVGWRAPGKFGSALRLDIINNIVHNWTNRLIRIDDWSYTLNHVGNYYTTGGRGTAQAHTAYFGNRNGRIYENDNFEDPRFTTRSDWWTDFDQPRTDPLPTLSFVSTPFPYNNLSTLNIKSSSNLKTEVLPFVGCYKYIDDNGVVQEERDNLDASAIQQAITEDQTQGSAQVSYDIILSQIPTQNNVRPVGFYGTNPHIPAIWLRNNGYANTSNIHNQVEPDGYTVLEKYLNQVDGPIVNIPVITLNGNSVVNLNVGDTYNELGATATDVEDGDLTGSIVVTGSVDTNTAGTYQLFYNVQDNENNSAIQVVRTINVNSVVQNVVYSLSDNEIFNSKRSKLSLIKRGSL